METKKTNDKIPNGVYFRLLTEIAPRIYPVLLERAYREMDKDDYLRGAPNPESLASVAVYHAKALIKKIFDNRFYND